MKKIFRILKWVGIVLVSLIIIFVVVVLIRFNKTYDAPLPDIQASNDSTVIARGKYLVFGPAHCAGCHIPFEEQGKLKNGGTPDLKGGFVFKLPIGSFYTPNITPDKETGIGNVSDELIARSMRHGVRRDNRAMLPFMPFQNLSDEDLTAIISYLRSAAPVKNKVPDHSYNFIGKAVYALMLGPEGPSGTPPQILYADTTAKYGQYLVNSVSNCRGCHTDRSMMTGAFTGPELAGGLQMESQLEPGSKTVSPNLTPDPETGKIFSWTQAAFLNRFHTGRQVEISEMPWESFQQISDNDLIAIYKYLKTVPPVKQDNGPAVVRAVK